MDTRPPYETVCQLLMIAVRSSRRLVDDPADRVYDKLRHVNQVHWEKRLFVETRIWYLITNGKVGWGEIILVTIKGFRWVSKTQNGYIYTIFFYISNEIFYSNSLPYKRYIFDEYFVKFLLKNFENSVIGTSSPVTLQKKSSLGVVRITHDRFIWN